MPVIGQPAHTHFTPVVSAVVLDRISLSVTYLYNVSAASYRVSLARTYVYDLRVIVSRSQIYVYHVNPVTPTGPTRLYFHNILNPVANLPTTERSTLTSNKTVDAETINRTMTTLIGTAQTVKTNTANATTALQRYYFTRFVSETLQNVSSITAQTWTYNFAGKGVSTSANFPTGSTNQPVRVTAYVWRPSTSSKVGDIVDGNSASTIDESTAEKVHHTTFSGNQVLAVQQGDVLCFEVWFEITQAAAQPLTEDFYYDGSTVNTTKNTTVTNHASFLETPQGLAFGAALTRVSKSCIQKYDIVGRVTGFSQVYKYSITALASLARTYQYAITTRATLSRSYLYNLTGRLSVPSISKYNILVRMAAPKIFRYTLQSTLQTSKTYRYNITSAVGALSQVYKYNIANAAQLVQTYKYQIYKAVQLSKIYRYSLIARLSVSPAYKYNIANRLSQARVYRYALAVKLSLSRAYKYNLLNRMTASSHYRYSILEIALLIRNYKYNIAKRITLGLIYKYNLTSLGHIVISSVYKYNLVSRLSSIRTYNYNITNRLSLSRTYKYNLSLRVTLSRIYKYEVLKASISLSSHYVYNITTFLPSVTWQITGKNTDFPDSLENLVKDYIKENWSITEPAIGANPAITTVLSRQHQTQVDNFAYDSYRSYYIRIKEVASEVKNRQVRLNTYEFSTPVELELFARRLKKGEAFPQLNAMMNELQRIFGTYQPDQIFGVQGISLDRISSMEKERPPAKNIWARRLRIILHYYKISVAG